MAGLNVSWILLKSLKYNIKFKKTYRYDFYTEYQFQLREFGVTHSLHNDTKHTRVLMGILTNTCNAICRKNKETKNLVYTTTLKRKQQQSHTQASFLYKVAKKDKFKSNLFMEKTTNSTSLVTYTKINNL